MSNRNKSTIWGCRIREALGGSWVLLIVTTFNMSPHRKDWQNSTFLLIRRAIVPLLLDKIQAVAGEKKKIKVLRFSLIRNDLGTNVKSLSHYNPATSTHVNLPSSNFQTYK